MKILLICESPAGHSGWSTYARNACDGLRGNGHDVRICSIPDGGGEHAFLPRPLDALGKPWLLPVTALKLRSIAKEYLPDVIHITVEPYALAAALLPGQWLRRTVLTVHGSYGVRPLLSARSRFLSCRGYARLGGFIAVSEYTKQAVTETLRTRCSGGACGNFSSRVRVIKNGIVLPPWAPRTGGTTKNILLVGGVKPRKGILEALEGCAAYKKRFGSGVVLTVVGGFDEHSPYMKNVRARIEALDLWENVRLAGALSDDELERLYAQADLYLMPSPTTPNTFEGYGIAFIEANARGIPCIGPDSSGAAQAIDEGKSGYRVDPSDAAMIADRMHRVLDEHAIRPEDCRAWAERHRLEDRICDIEKAYTEIISIPRT